MANKYNYQLRSFISSQFAYAGNRFFTCWCNSDGNAEALRSTVAPYMVNFTKIGLSRQIVETPAIVIPQNQLKQMGLKDVRLYRFWLQGRSGRYSLDIPFGKDFSGLDTVVRSIKENCVDNSGNAIEVVAYRVYGVDIVTNEV